MSTEIPPERGWRGSADVWLDAAYQVLITSGVEAVKVMPLAQSLGLSRTSFYWHFPDREALLAGLVTRWQSRNSANLLARTEAPAATVTEAVLNLFDCWITPDLFDAALEFAVRNWSLTDARLAETLSVEDTQRLEALRAMFARFGFAPDQADIRARTIYLTQIGYIAMRTAEPRALRLQRMPAYVEAFTGQAPSAEEVATFLARNGGVDADTVAER